MGAIGVVSLIIALIMYWGFHLSGLWSALIGAILGPVLVAVFQVAISSLLGAKPAEATGGDNTAPPPPKQE